MPGSRDAFNRWVAVIKRIKQLAAAHERGDPLSIIAPAVLEVLQWADDIPVLKQDTASQLIFGIKVGVAGLSNQLELQLPTAREKVRAALCAN